MRLSRENGSVKKNVTADKQHAHQLLDRLNASQLPTAVRFLEFMLLDPLSRALATAPYDDEPLSDAGRRAIDEASEWFQHNQGIPHEEVLAEFGLTREDFDKMGDAPATEKAPSKTKPRRNG
jgi:hypothetical protein